MATYGFGTCITTETPENLKPLLGGVSYLIHGLMRMGYADPDRCEMRRKLLSLAGRCAGDRIGNGQAGGGQQYVPPR